MKIKEFQQKYYEALVFACEIHKNQMYDNKSYIFHLSNVGMTLTRFGFDMETFLDYHIAALLHDSVEDVEFTGIKLNDIRKKFGNFVAEIVDLVTDEDGENRKERHEKTYPKIATNRHAIIIKLADRISNIEYSIATNNLRQYKKYLKEYEFFRNTLFHEDHIEAREMWKCLDECFEWRNN